MQAPLLKTDLKDRSVPTARSRWTRRPNRRGLAAVEEVLMLAVALPLAAVLFFFGIRLFGAMFEVIDSLVSMPIL
jgi:hypothetical protein